MTVIFITTMTLTYLATLYEISGCYGSEYEDYGLPG
jgi:hypothetical protein